MVWASPVKVWLLEMNPEEMEMRGNIKIRVTMPDGTKHTFVGREQRNGAWVISQLGRFGRKQQLSTWANVTEVVGEIIRLARRAQEI
jgi:hypothetical protein